jgi:hypothetical protein
LFVALLCAYGLCPVKTVNDIYYNDDIRDRFLGVLDLFLSTEEKEEFVSLLAALIGLDNNLTKKSQSIGQTWYYVGLIERMLEPARGNDFTINDATKIISKELWEKIEAKKKETGLDPLPFDVLLQIQSEGLKVDPNKHLEMLLSNNRIW